MKICLPPARDDQLLIDLLKRAETENQASGAVLRDIERAIRRRLHHRADLLVREVQLLPVIGGVGREEAGVALIEETAGLVLNSTGRRCR